MSDRARKRAPTMKDVARRAGVSQTTVSFVINETPNISIPDETRQRVLEAVATLNYRPSRVARRLRLKHTQLIGLIISDIRNPFFTAVTRGIEDIASENGYSLILCNTDENFEKERLYAEIMHDEAVAGMIVATTQETEHDPALYGGEIPVVAVDRQIRDLPVDTVLVDNVRGAGLAVDHLLLRGHRRIGLICGRHNLASGYERHQGYEEALTAAGMTVEPDLIRHGDHKQASGYEQAMVLLSASDPPTALFVINNMMTLGALEAIHERGLRIPQDIAVVGFDDMPWSVALQPPLTTVAQPTYELGTTVAELLLKRISDPERAPVSIRLDPELVIRQSSGTMQ